MKFHFFAECGYFSSCHSILLTFVTGHISTWFLIRILLISHAVEGSTYVSLVSESSSWFLINVFGSYRRLIRFMVSVLKHESGARKWNLEHSNSPKKNVKIRAYSEPLIREIAEKQIRWVIDNS